MTISEATSQLLRAAYEGNLKDVSAAITDGADVESMPAASGLSALHLAVGRSHFEVLKYLIEEARAEIKPDGFGRWPTLIAAECHASDEVCDYIVEREAEAVNSASRATSPEREIDFD